MTSEGPPAIPAASERIQWLALAAVFLGTIISTLTSRLSTFGLGDIRGAVHAGFDEGAWITTAQGAAQVLVAPLAVWLGTTFGPRRVLIEAATAFAVISLLAPLSPNLQMLLGLQFAGGLASGFFVPLTLAYVLNNTPPRIWAYGIAMYALNLEISLHVSASLEGWYVEHFSWRFIYWQNVPLAIAMIACLVFGSAAQPTNPNPPKRDWFGFASIGIGLGLLYAGLDQGNRLDWQNSPLVCALLLAGMLLVAAFFRHERTTSSPALNLTVMFEAPLPRMVLLIAMIRTTILSTAYLIPQYLGVVRGFHALEIGQTLWWIAAPQLLTCLIAGYSLRRLDARVVASFGFFCVCCACLMVAHGLTPLWGSDQFLPSQLIQSVGQSLALSGVVFFGILHLRREDALTFGATLQTARVMGGEIGQAFITTFVRVREQIASNLLGLHIQVGDLNVIERVQTYGAIVGTAGGASSARAESVLANVVQSMATTQAIIDAMVFIAGVTAIAMLILVTRGAAPIGPASHVPLRVGLSRSLANPKSSA